MPWEVNMIEEHDIIEIIYTGKINITDIHESTDRALSMVKGEEPQLFLADHSNSRLELTVSDIYTIPDQWEAANANKNNLIAVVTPESAASIENAKFYENVTTNRGWNVKVFKDRESALDWMLKK